MMQLDPEVMRRMSLWQFQFYLQGWKGFHCASGDDKPGQVDDDEWADFLREKDQIARDRKRERSAI